MQRFTTQRQINRRGFTLVEVMLSLAILGLLLGSAFSVFGSTVQASASANTANNLLKESQVAEAIVTNRARNACYVYPSGSTLDLGATPNTVNPFASNASTWTVGTHPILALVLPPDPTTDARLDYRFVAIFALPTAQYRANAPYLSAPPTPGADQSWVLMMIERPFKNVQIDGIDADDNDATPPIAHASHLTCAALAQSVTLGQALRHTPFAADYLLGQVVATPTLFVTTQRTVSVSWIVQDAIRVGALARASFSATLVNEGL